MSERFRNRPLTRREAMLAMGGIIAGATVYNLARKSPINLASPEIDYSVSEELRPEDIMGNVNIPDSVALTVGVNGSVFQRVSANKRLICEGIIDIAEGEGSKDDELLLYKFISRFPLDIELRGANDIAIPKRGPFGVQADYTPLFFGGPKIEFHPNFLRRYWMGQKSVNFQMQEENDEVVWHELTHFWQDIKNSLSVAWEASKEGVISEIMNSLGQDFDPGDFRAEREANEKASEVVESIKKDFLKVPLPQNWPLGKFFAFTPV